MSSKHTDSFHEKEEASEEEEIKEVDFNEWKNEIHVDKKGEKGAYKTIQAAIDAATPKTKIVIHPGIYREHLIIDKKSDIEIRSLDPEMPAILMASNSPCILIKNMLEGQAVKLGYLRIVHRGMREVTDNNSNIYEEMKELNEQADKLSNDIYNHLQGQNWIYSNVCQLENFDTNYSLDISAIEGIMTDNRGVVTAISIFNSTVMLINTQITLGFLTTETTKTIPGIYCERAVLFMESVMVRGNPEFLTCGLLAYETSIKITNSRMVKHKSGGFLASINPSNQIIITKCQFLENTGCGLLIVNKQRTKEYHEFFQDPDTPIKDLIVKPRSICALTSSVYINMEPKKDLQHGEVSIEGILCDSNVGAGIRIENCCNLSLTKNRFYENIYNGGEIVDCEGIVMLNEFVKNGENGLLVNAFIRKTEIKISKNTFCENEFNGLLINGRYNNCIVQGNEKITGNMKSGICVNGLAFPIIKQNGIYCNLHQGVLVCDDACASIEENKIYSNLKANIAFGGETGLMTRVIDNDIYRSRSEGVFCIDSTGGIVSRNKIFENNDGIVLFNAKNIEVSENDITNNVRSGCLIGAESEPSMFKNQVKENKFIGIMFRDGSKGEYYDNIIENNPTQCYYTNSCKDLIDIQEEKNKIKGRIDTETGCNIF